MDLFYHYLRLLIAFPLVVLLTYFTLRFFLPRFAPALGMGRRVQVVERTALNSRTFLYIVKVGNDYLLIASAGGAVTLLKDLGTSPDEEFLSPSQALGKEVSQPLTFTGVLEKLKEKSSSAIKRSSTDGILQKIFPFDGRKPKKKEKIEEDSGNLSRILELEEKNGEQRKG
ncbi:MAG: flagellar biosynthetic protein FliO [Bacillota bacterium]|nr:flagellar biosynthetic protein FliO [Bacillota bacterium]